MKLLLLFAAVAAASPIVRRQDKQVSGRSGAVATNFAKCSDVGRDILQSGGTAADAAVAAVLCIGVIGGSLSGIGAQRLTVHCFERRLTLSRRGRLYAR
jgi:gamma-glutamyltranspeptidase